MKKFNYHPFKTTGFFIVLLVLAACNQDADAGKNKLLPSTKEEVQYAHEIPIKLKPHQYLFEPDVVTVSGMLTTEMFYGAPNYGESPESDAKEYAYILVLDSAIDVINNVATNMEGEGHFTELGVKKVQLIFEDQLLIRSLKNKRVKLSGVFINAQTGHHHTAVLLNVSKVE